MSFTAPTGFPLQKALVAGTAHRHGNDASPDSTVLAAKPGFFAHFRIKGARLELISDPAGVHNQVQHLLSILGRELLHMGNQYSHLSSEERACIMLRLRDGFSSRAIARELRRSPSSVTREIAKHHSLAGCGTLPYEASRSSMRAPRVRQLNAQVIDCYEPGFKNVYYKRDNCCG